MSWGVYAAFLAAIILSPLAWWFIPRLQVRKLRSGQPAEKVAELEDEYRKTITNALAGALVLISAGAAFVQLQDTRESAAAQLRETARKTDMEYENTELATAFGLLGKNSIAEHLGGIHLLQAWADGKPFGRAENRHQILTDALAGFVRDRTQFSIVNEECSKFQRPISMAIGQDVQAALHILVRESHRAPIRLNFRALDLSRADLSSGDFTGSNFAFSDLSEANLSKAQLAKANFYCANLYKINLSGADLSSAVESTDPDTTNLIGAIIIKANLSGTLLRNANLADAHLNESDFSGTNLRGARLDSANLFRTNLSGAQANEDTDLAKACLVETIRDTDLSMTRNFNLATEAKSGTELEPGSRCTR
jgi:uncharacterized protein YjbI with pentapeptide repeats